MVLVVVVVPEFTPLILTVFVVGPLLQLYVFAPVTVSVALEAEHTVPEGAGVTVKLGRAFMVTAPVAVFVQLLASVPVRVYVSVPEATVGVAVTELPVVEDKPPPAGGLQV